MTPATDAPRPARRRLPKVLRVLSRKDFAAIRAHGRTLRDALFRVGWRERDGATRLGLAVSTRVGDAPVRNRIKRVVREVFRLHRDQLPRGIDFVVIPLDGVRTRDFALVRESLLGLGARIEQQRAGGSDAAPTPPATGTGPTRDARPAPAAPPASPPRPSRPPPGRAPKRARREDAP